MSMPTSYSTLLNESLKKIQKIHPAVAYSFKSFLANISFQLSHLYLGLLCLLLCHIYIQIIYYYV